MRRLWLLVVLMIGCSRAETSRAREATAPAPPPVTETAPKQVPTPESALERRKRCLSYTAERQTFGEARSVKVRVRNSCDMTVSAEESEFEIMAMPSNGQGVVSRATGRFPSPIGPHSSNVETTIDLDCPGDVHAGCKYFVEPL